MKLGINALLIVPNTFTSASFGSCTWTGLPPHNAGTTLTIPTGEAFSSGPARSMIRSICHGAIAAAASNSINLNNGLMLYSPGVIAPGSSGTLTVNDGISGISGGQLSAGNQYVGNGGTGGFEPTGGLNTVTNILYVGYGAAG